MNSRKVAMEIRLAGWTQALKERIAKGESINEFCQNKGINRNAYFYWQRKVREAVCEQLAEAQNQTALPEPAFKEVVLAEPILPETIGVGCICVETSSCKITAGSAYPTEALAALLRELVRPC